AVEARQAARELYHAHDDPLREGYALSRLTIAYIRLGRNAEAEEASRAAIQLLETLPPGRELACAYSDQAYARMLSRDNAEGVAWGEKAVEAATALGDSDILAYGLNMIGTSHLMSGEIERGVEYLRRSLEVARTEGLEVWIVSALGMLGSGLGEMVELEQSERFLRECIAFSEAHEITPSYSQAWLALVQVYRGRWDEGTRLASALLARTPDPISRISALIALGRLRARRGDPGALDALDEALESARPGGHLQRLGHVHAARAEAAWLAGDAARTAEEAAAAYPLALEKRHLWFAGELAYWQWKAGELAEAPGWIAEPYRLQVAGDARAAASAWAARGCPYEAARALAEADDEALLLEALTRSNGWAPARPRRSSGRRCAPRVRPSHAGRAQRHGRTPRS
ncbi:MAG: tetratricopeptide repeat protein, partial [Gaiellaceae bacterium]